MITIPLKPLKSQIINSISLSNQFCNLNIYQKFYGLFMDVYVNNNLIIGGVICQDRNRIVRSLYLGFNGDFSFIDTLGTDDPDYTGLGSRWFLVYLTPDEVDALVA